MVEIGQTIDGKYRILRKIGEGGMGAVFEGENVRINRRVAIKVLHAAASSNADVVRRFEREAQAAGRIGSDHILEILDLGELQGGERYLVMEYLQGETLAARLARVGRLSPQQLIPLMRQVLLGLGAAHAAGIVHRDLKPDNIFILQEKAGISDFVKIIDFGISKFSALAGDLSMTRTGSVMGTPYYMSPEQAQGERQIDHKSDLYALGVIMYEALASTVPFNGETFNELMFKIVLSTPPSLRQVAADVDPAFVAIVERAMAREPARRFDSCEELKQALDEYQRGAGAAPGRILGEAAGARTVRSAAAPPTHSGFSASQAQVAKRSTLPAGVALAAAGVVLAAGAYAAFNVFSAPGAQTTGSEPAASAAVAAAQTPATDSNTPDPEQPEPDGDAPASTAASAAPSAAAGGSLAAPPATLEPSAASTVPPAPQRARAPAQPRSAAPLKPNMNRPSDAKAPDKPQVSAPSPPGNSRDFGY
jgi:serine/threonine-protein kinase